DQGQNQRSKRRAIKLDVAGLRQDPQGRQLHGGVRSRDGPAQGLDRRGPALGGTVAQRPQILDPLVLHFGRDQSRRGGRLRRAPGGENRLDLTAKGSQARLQVLGGFGVDSP